MYTENKLFAERIKELRSSWGLTQQQMADMVGLRKTTISNYESGYATPTISTLKRLMLKFNLPASYFVPDMANQVEVKKAQLIYGTPMPYYEPSNVDGLITGEKALMDSSLTLPSQMHLPKEGYIATCVTDNSMNKCGIKRGSCIIINTENKSIKDGDIFAAIKDHFLIVRKYHNTIEGAYMSAESTRIPTGLSVEEIPTENFTILGVIERVISKL